MAKRELSLSDLQSYLTSITKLVGSGSLVRLLTPRGSKSTFASVSSPTSVFFSEFPLFLGDEHEPAMIQLDSLNSCLLSFVPGKSKVAIVEDALHVRTSKGKFEVALQACSDAVDKAPEVSGSTMELELSSEFHAFLNSTLPLLGMEKIHAAQADFRLYVNLTKSSVFLAVYGPQQVVFLNTQNEFGIRGNFNVPYAPFQSFVKSLPTSKCTLQFCEDVVAVKSPTFTFISQMAPLSPKDPPGERVQEFTSEAFSALTDENSVTFPKDSLLAFLTNTKGIVPDDAPVRFTQTEKGVRLVVNSPTAKVNFALAGAESSLEEDFAIESKFLKNLSTKSGPTVSLKYRDGSLLMQSGSLGMMTTTYAESDESQSGDEV